MKEFQNPTILKILDRYRTLWALGHFSAVAGWDQRTYMPKDGAGARAEAFAKISSLSQKIFLEKEFVSLIKKAQEERLNDYEKGIVRLLKRDLKIYQKLPPEFIEEFARVTSKAESVWEDAKRKNNFALFEPYLQKIIELSRKKAEYLGYERHPYDALLDEYEEGLTTRQSQEYFSSLKPRLSALFGYIKDSENYSLKNPLKNTDYNLERMKMLSSKIIDVLHGNKNNLRLDIAEHPFTMHLSTGDTRITTRYIEKDFTGTISSNVHEFGHALYDLQCNPNLEYTPVGHPISVVMHESQSRFWENIIGRSKEFIKIFEKDIKSLSPGFSRYSLDDIYRGFNTVRPSLVRTEADEVSYHFHIMLRFELEKEMIEGKITAKELASLWADKYEKYLGIRPKTFSEGILQDVHWSGGSIGYFPTYSMGTAASAIWKERIEKDFKQNIQGMVNEKGFPKIKEWLKNNIHQYGSAYTFNDLLKKKGIEFSSRPLMKYLEEKYKKLY